MSPEAIPTELVAEAIFSDFTFVHETPEEKERRFDPSFDYEDDDYRRILSSLPSGQEQLRRLPDRPPHTGSEVWAVAISLTAAFWQLLGLPGALQFGDRVRNWLRARKGRTGNATALLPVAVWYIDQKVAHAHPDLRRVQILDPCRPDQYPVEYQAVYLYRIYDYDGERVYVVELASDGTLIQLSVRKAARFELDSTPE